MFDRLVTGFMRADNFPLLAVPFFILAGELMNAGGLSRKIIEIAIAMVGHIHGAHSQEQVVPVHA